MNMTDHQPIDPNLKFLTVAEIAAILRVSKMTVYRLIETGDITALRIGRSFRVPEDDVRQYLERAMVT